MLFHAYFVCKCCGGVYEVELLTSHYATHKYGEPHYQGFKDGERKSFRVLVKS